MKKLQLPLRTATSRRRQQSWRERGRGAVDAEVCERVSSIGTVCFLVGRIHSKYCVRQTREVLYVGIQRIRATSKLFIPSGYRYLRPRDIATTTVILIAKSPRFGFSDFRLTNVNIFQKVGFLDSSPLITGVIGLIVVGLALVNAV